MKTKIQSEMKHCSKCGRFRAFYIYPDKFVCYGCGKEIKKEVIQNE